MLQRTFLQMTGLLDENLKTGGSFCERVVDLAVEIADTTVLLSLDTARIMGQDSAAIIQSSSLFSADTACNAEHQRVQAQLDEHLLSQNSSRILTVPNTDSFTPDGVAADRCSEILFCSHTCPTASAIRVQLMD